MLNIVKFPNPVLKKVAAPVSHFDQELATFVEAMIETMYGSLGIGLAAPQVADLRRLFVVDINWVGTEEEPGEKKPTAYINPKIIDPQGEILWEEGCLSLPGLIVPVRRAQKITIKYQDVHGQSVEATAEDLQAICIQHEFDHLNGVILTDRLTKEELNLYKKKMERGEILKIESNGG
jgi:peptide deformylase